MDRERVALLDIVPPRNRIDDHRLVDSHLKARVRVSAGPPRGRGHLPQGGFGPDRDPEAALSGAIQLLQASPHPAGGLLGHDRRPFVGRRVPGTLPAANASSRASRSRHSEEEACAETILRTLVSRAYRRPAQDSDLAGPMGFFRRARAEAIGGVAFEAGIESALSAILVSPEFLFRIERDPPGLAPGTAYRVSDLELASRLSFFLWSSIPDDELLASATSGALRTSEGLERQVRRMLADERSVSLVDNFASAVAALAEPCVRQAEHEVVPGLRRQPPAGLPTRDRAAPADRDARGPKRAGVAGRRLHLRERAPCPSTTGFRTCTGAAFVVST